MSPLVLWFTMVRLTVRLDQDVYAIALALSRSEHISLAEAINRLVRKGTEHRFSNNRSKRRTNFPTSSGRKLITADEVKNIAEGNE
jgi:hypothetical protein